MVGIVSNWNAFDGGKHLFLRPDGEVSGEDWVNILDGKLEGFDQEGFNAVVDLLGVFDNTGFDGFNNILDLLIRKNITKYRLVVLSTDEKIDLLVTLFQSLAEAKNFDLEVKISVNLDGAEAWFKNQ